MNFYILDDDISTRRILAKIIKDENLGQVIGEEGNPSLAVEEILSYQPNIILIDLLMPLQDGIETVHQLVKQNCQSKFIMISQIENKDMVGSAYEAGIEYFIHKPINKIEVTSVVKKVVEKVQIEISMQTIKENLQMITLPNQKIPEPKPDLKNIIREIFVDLGILGEAGSTDVAELIKYIIEKQVEFDSCSLKTLYAEVLLIRNQTLDDKAIKAFEQRLRRAINQALTNLASLGLTDYTHPKFEQFSSKFFDFNEVRLKMNELDETSSTRTPRINIRKFLFAFLIEVQERL